MRLVLSGSLWRYWRRGDSGGRQRWRASPADGGRASEAAREPSVPARTRARSSRTSGPHSLPSPRTPPQSSRRRRASTARGACCRRSRRGRDDKLLVCGRRASVAGDTAFARQREGRRRDGRRALAEFDFAEDGADADAGPGEAAGVVAQGNGNGAYGGTCNQEVAAAGGVEPARGTRIDVACNERTQLRHFLADGHFQGVREEVSGMSEVPLLPERE